MTPSHAQSVIRHLVSANVLLKEQLDKQSDEKNSLRKKFLQLERDQSQRERALAAKQKECDELKERLLRQPTRPQANAEHEHEHEDEENNRPEDRLISAATAFKASPVKKNLTSTPKSTFLSISSSLC